MLQLTFVNFKKGSYILVEGKADADLFYIIHSGQVCIAKQVEIVAEEEGNVLTAGNFLGVVACMSRHNQIETAVALTDVVLIAIRYEQFPQLIEKNAAIAMKIILSFTKKMRYLNEALTQLTLKKHTDVDVSHLFAIGEYYVKMTKFELALYAYYHYLKESPKGTYAEEARKRFVAIKSTGVKVPVEILEPNILEATRCYYREAMVFCECQLGNEFYIIQKGHVKITKIVDNNEVVLAILKEGDMFGEMALLENKPRSASAIVMSDGCQLLAVNRKNFQQLVATQPQLTARLTTTLADRIWSMYRQLANTLLPEPTEKMYDMLAIQLEKIRYIPSTGKAYDFEFGPIELAHMCGFPKDIVSQVTEDFLREPIVRCVDNKISVTDDLELVKRVAYFKKKRTLAKARKDPHNRQ